jgi:hypothetical protein
MQRAQSVRYLNFQFGTTVICCAVTADTYDAVAAVPYDGAPAVSCAASGRVPIGYDHDTLTKELEHVGNLIGDVLADIAQRDPAIEPERYQDLVDQHVNLEREYEEILQDLAVTPPDADGGADPE